MQHQTSILVTTPINLLAYTYMPLNNLKQQQAVLPHISRDVAMFEMLQHLQFELKCCNELDSSCDTAQTPLRCCCCCWCYGSM
jgi:hypothetical protein